MPLSHIQTLIAQRMLRSKRTKPCFYLEACADVTELMHLRHSLKKTLGTRITTNCFYVRAIALAARKFPLVTASLNGDYIKLADRINIGFAVSAPQGLVVPVIKNADTKTLAQLADLEKNLTQKALSNKLTLDDIELETIALSNLGAYNIDSFLGIVPPQTGLIVAVGNCIKTVVPLDGIPTIRQLVTFTVAADASILTPPYAAGYLKSVIELLQSPKFLT